MRFIHGGGFVMYPLMLLSLAAITVIVERLLAFRKLAALPPKLLDETITLYRVRRIDDAIAVCGRHQGPVAACLAVILRHRAQPLREVERIVEETGQEYFMRLEHLLPVLDTTTTIAPLLGLLGTIVGMIGAFNHIANGQSHGNNDAVLGGVGEALYATASGLIVAVVCFIAYNYFSARIRTVTSYTEQASTKLLNVMVESHHTERQHGISQPELEETSGVQTKTRA